MMLYPEGPGGFRAPKPRESHGRTGVRRSRRMTGFEAKDAGQAGTKPEKLEESS